MAALSEADLEKILGENFRAVETATQKATGVEDQQRETTAKISSLEDKNFSSFASISVGIALVFSAFYTAKDLAFTIQMVIAIGFIVIGVFAWFRFRKQIGDLREQLKVMQANSAAAKAA